MGNGPNEKAAAKTDRTKKFFTIVDGDEGLCLVGVDPPIVHYLSHEDIKLVAQHLSVSEDGLTHEYIAMRLSANWGGSKQPDGFEEILLTLLREIRARNLDGSFGTGDVQLVNACLVGPAPMSVLVGRGKR